MAARKNTLRRLAIIGAAVLGGALGYVAGYNLLLDWLGQQAHALVWYQVRAAVASETFYRIAVPTVLGSVLGGIGAVALLRRR